jgi:hypothetical protein
MKVNKNDKLSLKPSISEGVCQTSFSITKITYNSEKEIGDVRSYMINLY